MKAAIVIIVIALAAIIGFGGLKLTTNPFSISIPQWRTALAVILFFIGCALIYRDGVSRGINVCSEYIIQHLKDESDKHTK